jgi:hypothetical protein
MIPSFSQQPDFQARALASLAEEKMIKFLKLMDRWETIDWRTLKNIVTTAVWDYKEKMELFKIIKQYDEGLEDIKPKDVPGLEYRFLNAVPNTFRIAEKLTGATGVGSIVFEIEDSMDDWENYNPDLLIRGYNEGNFGRWSGNPRTGKTNGALVSVERWVDKGYIALANIAKKEETNTFIHTRDARSLFETLTTIPRQTKWIFIYDEGGLTDSKQHSSTLHARYMNDIYRVIGKTWGNALYIDQLYSKCPETIETFSTVVYHSVKKGTVYFELKGEKKFRRTFVGFPKTNIPYDTRDLAYFDSKSLNVEALFSAISGITNEKERYDAMADFLKSPASKPKVK